MNKINLTEKKKALLRFLNNRFDACRLVIYDILSDVIKNDEYLDYVKRDLDEIETIRDMVWELESVYDEASYDKVDKTFISKCLDNEVIVDYLVDDCSVEKAVAEAICIDIYGKLWEQPKVD